MWGMRIRDVDLAVEQTGRGPRMLWCHGLTSSMGRENERDLFGNMPEAIVAQGLELVRYDARGHGRSGGTPDPEDYRWDNLAQDAKALHDEIAGNATEPWVVGGASMGAATTLHLAVTHPHLVRAMVLVIPPTAWETRAAQRQIYEKSAEFVQRNGTAAYVAASRALPPLPLFADQPDHGRFAPDISDELLPTVLRGAAGANLPDPQSIAAIGAPTLILSWSQDPGHPVSTGERLHELLPRSTFQVADTLAHVKAWGATVAAFAAEQVR